MKFRYLLLTFTLAWAVHPGARAASEDTWKDISNVGVISLIGTALIMPATREDWEGLRQAAYSIGSATAAAQIGKALVHEERPTTRTTTAFRRGTPPTPLPPPPPAPPLRLGDRPARLRHGDTDRRCPRTRQGTPLV